MKRAFANWRLADAVDRIRYGIQPHNRATHNPARASTGYHETITLFWTHMLRRYLNEAGKDSNIVTLTNRLSEGWAHKNLPFDFYSRERLMSEEALRHWMAPDLKPLPEIESGSGR
ncbi:MAG: hypothetical protein ACRD2L_08120 [Terriglobia bacterium]